MATVKELLAVLHENLDTSSDGEIVKAINLIANVQGLRPAERDCLVAAYEGGPVFDGDVPSKSGCGRLIGLGYLAKIVMRGDEGYTACTYLGGQAYRVLTLEATRS